MARYALHIVAEGEVRDKDGNVKETVPVDVVQEVELTDEQYAAYLASSKEK